MAAVSDTLHADHELARRLETLSAIEMRRFAETAAALDPRSGAQWRRVGGGIAAFVGRGSPVNMALGVGMVGPVTIEDVLELERFYGERGASAAVSVCPLADPTLISALAVRGWLLDGFEHVLVRGLGHGAGPLDAQPPAGVEVRRAVTEEDRDLWATVAAAAFSAPLPPIEEQVKLAGIAVARPGTQLFTGWVDGKIAGTAELYVEDGVAWLSADATLPQFQRRGVQRTLQLHRLQVGFEQGCTLAVTECAPGSISQRNMERLGFRIAYTRAELVLPGDLRHMDGAVT